MPFQAAFAIDELNQCILAEPTLASDPMVQAALAGDLAKLPEGDHFDGLMQILALTHAGKTSDEFRDAVEGWLASAKHPRVGPMTNSPTYRCRNCSAICGGRHYARLGRACLRHLTGAGCRLDSPD